MPVWSQPSAAMCGWPARAQLLWPWPLLPGSCLECSARTLPKGRHPHPLAQSLSCRYSILCCSFQHDAGCQLAVTEFSQFVLTPSGPKPLFQVIHKLLLAQHSKQVQCAVQRVSGSILEDATLPACCSAIRSHAEHYTATLEGLLLQHLSLMGRPPW